MDQNRFQEAQQAYDAGDYRTAAKGFLAAAGRGPDGNGAAYHMAGNALMRLRRYPDAVTVYGHAIRDAIYDRRGAVWSNLGSAYSEIGDYAEAAKAYEEAIAEPDYSTPYKAYQGMAGALLERGRVEEAAIAYRKAALDPGNPDPGKALVNLGLCFMGLGRPLDAVEAYRAALGFEQYKGRGKALANMGQAYVALGEYEDAVRSFEKATQMHSHTLSPSAQAAYETALAQARPAEPRTPTEVDVVEPATAGPLSAFVPPVDASHEASHPEVSSVAGSAEGVPAPFADFATDIAPAHDGSAAAAAVSPAVAAAPFAAVAAAQATSAAPEAAASARGAATDPDLTQPLAPFDHIDPSADLGIGDEAAVADFFSATDEQLRERDKEARRAERHERGPIAIWRSLIWAAVVVAIVAVALVGTYEMGFGWPTQAQTVGGMLTAYQTGGAVDGFWVAAPSKDVAKEMAKIPPMKSFEIGTVQRGATTSKATVTVTPKSGAALHYTVTLSREGVGWKVSAVDNDWSTTGG